MKRNNILHLVEYLYLGGIERILEQIAEYSDERVRLFFFTYETEILGGIGKQIKDKGIPVFNYKKKAGRDWKLLLYLFEVVSKNKIDVIHTHDFGPIEYAVLLKIRYPYLKLVHTQHTIVHFVRNWKYKLFFQFSTFFYWRIIFVSKSLQDAVYEQCPFLKKSAVRIIYNGIDSSKFTSQNFLAQSSGLNMVSICRISPEKNFFYLLNTCRLLKSKGIPFVLNHAGTSKNKRDIEMIYQFIVKNELEENIFLHGFKDNPMSILELGDIFLSSSKTEGHPVAVLEALACEKLCYCSQIPAHSEFGENIMKLFDISDEESLFNLLLDHYKVNPNTSEMRKLARQKVNEKFSIKGMINYYIDQY